MMHIWFLEWVSLLCDGNTHTPCVARCSYTVKTTICFHSVVEGTLKHISPDLIFMSWDLFSMFSRKNAWQWENNRYEKFNWNYIVINILFMNFATHRVELKRSIASHEWPWAQVQLWETEWVMIAGSLDTERHQTKKKRVLY